MTTKAITGVKFEWQVLQVPGRTPHHFMGDVPKFPTLELCLQQSFKLLCQITHRLPMACGWFIRGVHYDRYESTAYAFGWRINLVGVWRSVHGYWTIERYK